MFLEQVFNLKYNLHWKGMGNNIVGHLCYDVLTTMQLRLLSELISTLCKIIENENEI